MKLIFKINFERRSNPLSGDQFSRGYIFADENFVPFCEDLFLLMVNFNNFLWAIFQDYQVCNFFYVVRQYQGKTNFCKIIEDVPTKFVIESVKKQN